MHKILKACIFICLTRTHSYNFFLTEVKLFHIREIYLLQIECTEITSEDLLQKENKWCTIKIGMFSRKKMSLAGLKMLTLLLDLSSLAYIPRI